MSNKHSRKKNRRRDARPKISRVIIVVTLALMCIVGTSLLAQVSSRTNRKGASGQVSIDNFTASKPSREMIFAGTRMVASEEGYSISPAYQSFAGNGGTGTMSVTAPSGVNWTLTSSQSWITITFASGSGSGRVDYSVGVNSDSLIRSGYITVNEQNFNVYQGINFADVPTGYMFYDWIGMLAARGVTLGCGGGNFCPNAPVTQEQMAAFVIRALGMFTPPDPPSPRFADVTPANQFYSFIEQMGARGIWTGCGGGNYCPTSPVLREQMAAIVIRGRGEFNPPTPPTQRFYDVPPSHPFYNFIDRMAVLGITSGCGTGCNTIGMICYCPTDSVTRGQMAVFLVRAFNL